MNFMIIKSKISAELRPELCRYQIGADTLLNKKGTTWRKLSADEQQVALSNEANLIETLIAHPSLIKRPVLQTSTGYLVGFDESAYQQLAAS